MTEPRRAVSVAERQVPDDPELLTRMMSDLRACDDLYRPTNYWAYYEKYFLPELRRLGLRDFRRRHRSILTAFGATDLRPTGVIEIASTVPCGSRVASALNRIIDRIPGVSLGIWGTEPEWTTRYFYYHVKEKFDRLGRALEDCGTSPCGNPEDFVEIDDSRWSLAHLQYCSMIADVLLRIELNDAPVICELGAGLGRNVEVFARLFPHATLFIFDIPPQLYVANQFLTCLFGARVAAYDEAVRLSPGTRLPESVRGRIVLLPSWRLPDWSNVKSDLFWNSASFQEMEPNVVANYLRLVAGMSPDWVYINALPKGNFWGAWKPGGGGTRAPVLESHYVDALGSGYRLHEQYPTDYFLRQRDYVSSIHQRVIG